MRKLADGRVYLSGYINIGTWNSGETLAVWDAVKEIIEQGGVVKYALTGYWDSITLPAGKLVDDYGLKYTPGKPGVCASLRMGAVWHQQFLAHSNH